MPKEKVLSEKVVGEHTVRISEWKGRPTFGIHSTTRIKEDEEFTLIVGFGIPKAKAIVKHVERIKAFIAKYDKSAEDEE